MDIEKLLKLLNESQAEFVIIGASAFPIHGYARATLDTDFFIRNSAANAAKVLDCLKKFGYDVSDLSAADLQENKVLIRQYLVESDFHPSVKGVDFDEVWKNRVPGKIGDVEVNFASLDDLIKMKKAANRSKDREDLNILKRIKKKIKK